MKFSIKTRKWLSFFKKRFWRHGGPCRGICGAPDTPKRLALERKVGKKTLCSCSHVVLGIAQLPKPLQYTLTKLQSTALGLCQAPFPACPNTPPDEIGARMNAVRWTQSPSSPTRGCCNYHNRLYGCWWKSTAFLPSPHCTLCRSQLLQLQQRLVRGEPEQREAFDPSTPGNLSERQPSARLARKPATHRDGVGDRDGHQRALSEAHKTVYVALLFQVQQDLGHFDAHLGKRPQAGITCC